MQFTHRTCCLPVNTDPTLPLGEWISNYHWIVTVTVET